MPFKYFWECVVSATISWLTFPLRFFEKPQEKQKFDYKTDTEEENKKIEQEIKIQIEHLPEYLQNSFKALNIRYLDIYNTLQSICYLLDNQIKKHFKCLPEDFKGKILFEECGNFSVEYNDNEYGKCFIPSFVPSSVVLKEISCYVKKDDVKLFKILTWICSASLYWKKIFQKYEIKEIFPDENFEFILLLQPI